MDGINQTGMASTVEPYEHVRPVESAAGDGAPAGVYRAVGDSEGTVTLLCVADGDGQRVNSGRLVHVETSTFRDAFEPAENPDAGLRPLQFVDGFVEELRMIAGALGRLFGRG